MLLDIYIIRDNDYNTVKVFASELKAKQFKNHSPRCEVEHVEVDIPLAAMEIHRVNSTVKRTQIIKEIKTVKQIVDDHIEHVYTAVCNRDIKKAAKILGMNTSILKLELKRIIED